jgi:peptidoglycan hydrolase CwlO-like protein
MSDREIQLILSHLKDIRRTVENLDTKMDVQQHTINRTDKRVTKLEWQMKGLTTVGVGLGSMLMYKLKSLLGLTDG